jgi:hypothetical protein
LAVTAPVALHRATVMIRIRHILSAAYDGAALAEVQEIFRARFPYSAAYADQIPQVLDQPFERGYRTLLVVAERDLGKVGGAALPRDPRRIP